MMSRRACQRTVLLTAVAATLFVLTGGPAAAHPWGTPPVAVVTAEGDRVVVEWLAEPDDALLLGVDLGLVDPTLLDWSWDGPQAPEGSVGDALLPPAEPLEAYLLEGIRVFQDGALCPGEVEPFADFVTEGATTVHVCAQPVAEVELEIGMLHDLHSAYRTFAESSGDARPRQAAFTVSAPRHTWTFGAEAPGGSGGAWLQVVAPALMAAVVAAAAAHRRRRRRRRRGDGLGRPAQGRARELLGTGTHGIVPLGVLAVAEPQRFGWLEGEFVRLIDLAHVGPILGALAVVVAFAIGAAHALAPGHGKALISAYLVGARGRPADALALGAVVAAMHCGSVLVLGGVLFTTVSLQANVGQAMPWMSLLAGVLITAVGVGMVARQGRARARQLVTVGAGGRHDGHATHGHVHCLPEGVRPLSRRGVVALGVSGGLLPSPSAFLVLATAIVMGRALFGFALVAAFSVGLATTLTAFGLAAIKGRTLLEQRALRSERLHRFTAALPVVSSLAVLLGGMWIATVAVMRL